MGAVSVVLAGDVMGAECKGRRGVGGDAAADSGGAEDVGAVQECDGAGAGRDVRGEGYGLRELRGIERRRDDDVRDSNVDGAGCAGEVVGIAYVDRADGIGSGG